jgi:hypothetical protein
MSDVSNLVRNPAHFVHEHARHLAQYHVLVAVRGSLQTDTHVRTQRRDGVVERLERVSIR